MADAGKSKALIDPLYQKYVRSVVRALGNSEFYRFFMDSISKADNEFQFSNRKVEKTVDLTWVDAVEEALEGFQNIISLPRNVIKEEELIVNVANAKKAGADTVRHLAQHASMIDGFDEHTGDVQPGRLMQKYREDSVALYENRLVYTAMESAYHFVKIRHDALFGAMSDEFGAKLKLRSDMDSATEHVHMDMYLHIRNVESMLDTDDKNADVFGRISRIYRVLGMFMGSQFARDLGKTPRVKGAITKTNVLKRNPNYRKIVTLLEFLRQYDDIGYTIKVVEQAPDINDTFRQDIYHNILFNYLILKGYLEDPADRQLPTAVKGRQRALKPKFIKQIVEELTEDYDLPDVEIRKVLIEELTKQQLMQEEAAERRRLVEEQAQRKKAEQERIRAEKTAEKERLRREREAERERIRQEKAAEEARLQQEKMEREIEDRRRSALLKKELHRFREELAQRLDRREAAREAAKTAARQEDFADAAQVLEETQRRRQEAAERLERRRQEEKDRLLREEKAERERLRQEKQAAREKARQEEQAAREKARQEEEARRAQELRQQQEAAERARQEQLEQDMAALRPYLDEAALFRAGKPGRLHLRVEAREQADLDRRQREEARRQRRERHKQQSSM